MGVTVTGAAGRRAVRSALGVRGLIRRITDRPIPAEAVLLELSMGFAVSRMLAAVSRLGIADELSGGPKTAAEISQARGLHAATVHRVLRSLAVADVVRLDSAGRFSLTRVGRLLASEDPESLAAWVQYLDEESTQAGWARVGESMRDGKPSFPEANGASVWEWLAEHPREGAQFNKAMRRLTMTDVPSIVGSYPWPREGVICDVAGGVGGLLSGILQANPDLTGILVDHSTVLAQASEYLTSAGVRDRVTTVSGDLFTGFEALADRYLLKDVLHDWDDERCLQILCAVRAAAAPGSKVLLIELEQPRNEAVYPISIVDVHMLTQTDGGRQRSVAELKALLAEAGFTPGSVRQAMASTIIEGISP